MTIERIKELLRGEPSFRLRQVMHAVYQEGVSSFQEMTALPASLRQRLVDASILCIRPETVRTSRDESAHKTVMKLRDGKRIETVLMRTKPDLWTACISSQVGCALGCTFCATGLMGFQRNLTAEEITDQVLFWRQFLKSRGGKERLGNIVYMGMGEPLLNLENVFASLKSLSDPEQFAVGQRHLSVSTVGIVPGMAKFAKAFPQVNLALSLHAAKQDLRSKLVPANKSYSLEKLREALQSYFRHNNRKVFVEYVLLKDENDRPEDARALVEYLRSVAPPNLLHVNLIVWNPTKTAHSPSAGASAKRFINILKRANQPATFRKNLGVDIDGACGQLVVQNL